MSEMKFTKGKLVAKPQEGDEWLITREGAQQYFVALAYGNPGPETETAEANAHLFVAAHELYEALSEIKLLFQTALLCTNVQLAKEGMVYVRKADAILAKARGASIQGGG